MRSPRHGAERLDNLGHLQSFRTKFAVRDLAPAKVDRGRRRLMREDSVE